MDHLDRFVKVFDAAQSFESLSFSTELILALKENGERLQRATKRKDTVTMKQLVLARKSVVLRTYLRIDDVIKSLNVIELLTCAESSNFKALTLSDFLRMRMTYFDTESSSLSWRKESAHPIDYLELCSCIWACRLSGVLNLDLFFVGRNNGFDDERLQEITRSNVYKSTIVFNSEKARSDNMIKRITLLLRPFAKEKPVVQSSSIELLPEFIRSVYYGEQDYLMLHMFTESPFCVSIWIRSVKKYRQVDSLLLKFTTPSLLEKLSTKEWFDVVDKSNIPEYIVFLLIMFMKNDRAVNGSGPPTASPRSSMLGSGPPTASPQSRRPGSKVFARVALYCGMDSACSSVHMMLLEDNDLFSDMQAHERFKNIQTKSIQRFTHCVVCSARTRLRCGGGCPRLYFCSTVCQRLAWRNGHREKCERKPRQQKKPKQRNVVEVD